MKVPVSKKRLVFEMSIGCIEKHARKKELQTKTIYGIIKLITRRKVAHYVRPNISETKNAKCSSYETKQTKTCIVEVHYVPHMGASLNQYLLFYRFIP